ncbi:hypothetical protein ACEWY4_027635 [Coilia grayii]|uniref:PDZ domain-containing protein n=1 Tax=Coilia grayii TaxID=363190 RepID=A0ABD1IP53_9TELE
MKVTVCFGRTRVCVPCGDGSLTIHTLVQQAVRRYKRALGKDSSYWVCVHRVEHSDGGILDLDDTLCDVVDDRDRLVCVYDEELPLVADGNSSSGTRTRTNSPALSIASDLSSAISAFQPYGGGLSEIEVTPTSLRTSLPLQVRRSNDPALVSVALVSLTEIPQRPDNPSRHQPNVDSTYRSLPRKPAPSNPWTNQGTASEYSTNRRRTESGYSSSNQSGEISRGDQPLVDSCLEKEDKEEDARIEPVGQDDSSSEHTHVTSLDDIIKLVEVSNDGGPLGIHVVPFSGKDCRTLGLLVRRLESGGKAELQKLFREDDVIVRINNADLRHTHFQQAQTLFRHAMRSPIPPLGIPGQSGNGGRGLGVSSAHTGSKKPGRKLSILLRKGPDGLGFSITSRDLPNRSPAPLPINPAPLSHQPGSPGLIPGSVVSQPGSPAPQPGSPSPQTGSPAPICVKKVLWRGAANQDGRLRAGDRILQVNGLDVSGRGHDEVMSLLKATPLGGVIKLLVLRPTQDEETNDNEVTRGQHHGGEVATFDIALDQSDDEMGRKGAGLTKKGAGLGVSVKGTRCRETQRDLGIFVKNIVNGGAAWKDGRLRIDDQLLCVNGDSLLAKSNQEAMMSLRDAMATSRDSIQLVIARREDGGVCVSPSPENREHRISHTRREEVGVAQHYPDQSPSTSHLDDGHAHTHSHTHSHTHTHTHTHTRRVFKREGFGRSSVSEKRSTTPKSKSVDYLERTPPEVNPRPLHLIGQPKLSINRALHLYDNSDWRRGRGGRERNRPRPHQLFPLVVVDVGVSTDQSRRSKGGKGAWLQRELSTGDGQIVRADWWRPFSQ